MCRFTVVATIIEFSTTRVGYIIYNLQRLKGEEQSSIIVYMICVVEVTILSPAIPPTVLAVLLKYQIVAIPAFVPFFPLTSVRHRVDG